MKTPSFPMRAARHPLPFAVSLRKRRTWSMPEEATSDTSSSGSAGEGSKPATLTQEEVNRLVGETRKEARDRAQNDLLKALGVEKLDDAKALLTKARELEEQGKTDAQKLQEAQQRAERDNQALAQQLEAERKARRDDKRQAAITAAASAAKAAYPEDVLAWAVMNASDLLDKVVSEDGAVDKKSVDDLIAKAKAARPNYFSQPPKTPGSPSNAGRGAPANGEADRRTEARKLHSQMVRG